MLKSMLVALSVLGGCASESKDPDEASGRALRFSPTEATPTAIDTCLSHSVGLAASKADNAEAVVTASDITVTLLVWEGTAGAVEFFDDDACSQKVTYMKIESGSSALVFHYKVTLPETVTIAAVSPGTSDAYMEVSTTTKKVDGLRFSPATASAAPVDSCQVHAVELTAGSGDDLAAAPATEEVVVSLLVRGETADGVEFFADAACGSSVSTLSFAQGTSASTFYYKVRAAAAFTIAAAAPGFADAEITVEGTN